jgi:hypothetical protein
LVLLPAALAAQRTTVLLPLGSVAEDRARVAHLAGASTAGALARDGARVATTDAGLRLVLPELRVSHHSALVGAEHDGALWSGRGVNALVRGGVTVGWRVLRLTVVPELTYSQNAPFEVFPARVDTWSAFASPWRTTAAPADLPVRFGDAPITTLHLGQSALTAAFPRVTVGIASGNLWWGPGLRNALVLSDHAPGIPRAFVRTPGPINTPVGALSGELFVGGLTESLFFDRDTDNDLRSVSGLTVTLAPAPLPGLTVGLARLVVAPVTSAGAIAGHTLDALTTWNGGDTRDQMSSAFLRWVPPQGELEFWGEYARQRLPGSPREALTQPNADMGWTIGAQWARPRADGVVRAQIEFTDVAQSVVDSLRPPRDWSTGRNVVQGFTQRGQMLGLATGPGSTHGWLAVDRIRDRWSVGGFVARTRWENDAYYREQIISFFGHDVSLFGGVRGGWRDRRADIDATLAWERRYNYQFENGTVTPNKRGQRTENNLRLSLRLTPRAH